MIQNLTIPKLQALCGTVARCFPEGIVRIAGGALRDLLHDKPVKDIDVFICLQNTEGDGGWYDGCHELGQILHCEFQTSGTDCLDLRNSEGYSYGAFRLVDYPTGLHWHPVQLVFIEEHPVDNVKNHFDFGLSQVWCSENTLRMTPAYWFDHYNHRITYLQSTEPNEQRRLSSKQRAERLKLKYQGWKFDKLWQIDDVVLPQPPRKPTAEDEELDRLFAPHPAATPRTPPPYREQLYTGRNGL